MYKPCNKKLWSGRTDTENGKRGYRWHQTVNLINLKTEPLPHITKTQKGIVFLGFCCDEGVRRNGGRTGTKEGPAAIRQACASLAWHPSNGCEQLVDGGDILCTDDNLEQAQDELQCYVSKILGTGYLPIVLGGGHEVALGSFKGIQGKYPDKKIGIINFDAHFDMRQYPQGSHSGSSFLQIADFCAEKNQPFSYLVLGIQKKSNTRILYQKAQEHAVDYIDAKKVLETPAAGLQKTIREFTDKQDILYLTFCMDVFDQAYAPGVSAPCAGGLTPQVIAPLIDTIVSSGKLSLTDIAELNPTYDRDGQTARLAAHLVFSIIEAYTSISKV
jgi:formiminoglutamase